MSTPQTLCLDGDDWTVYWLMPDEWRSLRIWEGDPPDAASRRIPARVPGHVQSDLLRAGSLPSPYIGLHSRQWAWTSERDWVYEKRFTPGEQGPGHRLRLRFDGIDDTAHVYLNGEWVGTHSGQFVPAEWDVTERILPGAENRLLVVVERAPETGEGVPDRRWKARFAYGLGGTPRLPPVGLWRSVSLVATGPAWFTDLALHTNVATDQTEAAISLVCELDGFGRQPAVLVTEITQSGLPVVTIEDPFTVLPGGTSLVQSTAIKRVQLWWPNGHGRQGLYQARVWLTDREGNVLDRRSLEFGVRQVDQIPCEGAPPDSLPYGLSVNGKRVWLKGWNWVPLDLLYGDISEERYDRLLRLARDAGVNLLRVWGGGLIETETFYRLCDRYGIMVWQDFPQVASVPGHPLPSDPAYLAYVREQAETILRLRRNHPSLVLWCGGSELTREGTAAREPLGSDHPALAELRQMMELEDPDRGWLPTTPTGPSLTADPARRGELHDVHGPYEWLGLREHPRFFNAIDPLLHSEVGCAGAADPETLRTLFEGDPSPPSTEDPVWRHHGVRALNLEQVRDAFGELPDLEAWVRASQALQALGLQYAVEASRRRKWRCAGVLPWRLNESWPSAVGPSAVDYHGRPKPAYYAVKRAYRTLHVSARFETFDWGDESRFEAEVFLCNSGEGKSLLNVVATVTDLAGKELYQENLAAEAPENGVESAGDLSWRLPAGFQALFVLFLEVIDEEGDTIARNAYLHSRCPGAALAPFLSAPLATLRVERTETGVCLHNEGAAVALGITVEAPGALVGDSDFPLPPGGEREIAVTPPGAAVTVRAWNAPEVTL